MSRMKYFQDDHGRTLRVVVTTDGEVSLALIDKESRNAIYFPTRLDPVEGNNIEDCTSFPRMEEAARTCPLHVDHHS